MSYYEEFVNGLLVTPESQSIGSEAENPSGNTETNSNTMSDDFWSILKQSFNDPSLNFDQETKESCQDFSKFLSDTMSVIEQNSQDPTEYEVDLDLDFGDQDMTEYIQFQTEEQERVNKLSFQVPDFMKEESHLDDKPIIHGDWFLPEHFPKLQKILNLRALYLSEYKELVKRFRKEYEENMLLVKDLQVAQTLSSQQPNSRVFSSDVALLEIKKKLNDFFLESKKRMYEEIFKSLQEIAKDSNASSRKKKRLERNVVEILRNAYRDNPYPSEEEKEKIAVDCGISVRQVVNWMANRRSRDKSKGLNTP